MPLLLVLDLEAMQSNILPLKGTNLLRFGDFLNLFYSHDLYVAFLLKELTFSDLANFLLFLF